MKAKTAPFMHYKISPLRRLKVSLGSALNSSSDIVEMLVSDGRYALNVMDSMGDTCLHIAARAGADLVLKKIIELGYSPTGAVNRLTGRTALHSAAASGKIACCKLILDSCGSRKYVVIRDAQGATALDLALQNGHDTCAHALQLPPHINAPR